MNQQSPMKIGFSLVLLLMCFFSTQFGYAQQAETSIYSFYTKNGDTVGLTIAKDTSYICLRIHLKGKPIETIKEIKHESFRKFSYSYYLRPGGVENAGLDLNSVTVQEGAVVYVLSENSNEGNAFEPELLIKNIKTGKEIELEGDHSSKKGSLLDFRDNEILTITDN